MKYEFRYPIWRTHWGIRPLLYKLYFLFAYGVTFIITSKDNELEFMKFYLLKKIQDNYYSYSILNNFCQTIGA